MLTNKNFADDMKICKECSKDCICKKLAAYAEEVTPEVALKNLRKWNLSDELTEAYSFYLDKVDPIED